MSNLSDLQEFEALDARRTKHDPETCTRQPCGRCRTSPPPPTQIVVGSIADERRKGQIDKPARPMLNVEPQHLASSLQRTARTLTDAAETIGKIPARLQQYGPQTWRRVLDWEQRELPRSEPDDEDEDAREARKQATSDERREDIASDAHASLYAEEMRRLTTRIQARQRLLEKGCHALADDLSRLDRIVSIANPDAPATVLSKDMLAAQVAADGWCISCWKDEQHLTKITTRPSGEPWYKDLCRPCGQYKAENGELPPLDVLRQRHGKSKPKKAG